MLQLQTVDKPQPADDQVLIKVHAVSVNPLDWHMLRGSPLFMRLQTGYLKPKYTLLGADVAGEVEAVGAQVTQFKPGDAVYGSIFTGGFAEYALAKEKMLVHKPPSLSYAQAAAIPVAGLTALQALRDDGQITTRKQVLINGASGGVGTFAVQIAKSYNVEVTGVCSTRNVELVKSLGADHVIDYTKENFTRSGQQYDLIMDNAASHLIDDYRRALTPDGIYVMVGFSMRLLAQMGLFGKRVTRRTGQRFGLMRAKIKQDDLLELNDMIEAPTLLPIIDKTYPFEQLPEAVRYVDAGHARAKVVVQVVPEATA